MGTLILGRRPNGVIILTDKNLGEKIEITVNGFNPSRNECSLSINASNRYSIDREEIYIKKENDKLLKESMGENFGNR